MITVEPGSNCPICGCPEDSFEPCNQKTGRPRLCPQCGSLERQRALALAYQDSISHKFNFRDKRVLQVSTTAAEAVFLSSTNAGEVVTLDVRPEVGPDIVADLCSMPGVPDEEFDVVLASGVMQHVHTVSAALAEIHRVLRVGGLYVGCEALGGSPHTRQYSSVSDVTQWYGRDALERYNVGTFRILGREDFVRDLRSHFFVAIYDIPDHATGKTVMIHACIKHPAGFKNPD